MKRIEVFDPITQTWRVVVPATFTATAAQAAIADLKIKAPGFKFRIVEAR